MKRKLLFVLLLNLFLLFSIFFLLHKYNVIEIPFLEQQPHPSLTDISEDPFLLEKETLKKQWDVLTAKETLLEEKQSELDKNNQLLEEKQKEVNQQLENIASAEKEKQEASSANLQDESSMRNIAQKVSNVAPESGAMLLNDMEAIVAVEVVKMMDKIAVEKGTLSSSAYLISLMEPSKRKELVRLLSAYPTNMGNLNAINPDEPPK